MSDLLPISVVIATRDREPSLQTTLESFLEQSKSPKEIILSSSSTTNATEELVASFHEGFEKRGTTLTLLDASACPGAAPQRNLGVTKAEHNHILFADDDISLGEHCIQRLWEALQSDECIGGVNAMIENQQYCPLGRISSILMGLMDDNPNQGLDDTYAGRVVGPAVNHLPEDSDQLPTIVPVEWLNTTCVLYRKEALPSPVFPRFFSGASHGEDLALSLEVGKEWSLANARTARIYHHCAPGHHKANHRKHAFEELRNQYYITRCVLKKQDFRSFFWLVIYHFYRTLAAGIRTPRILLPRLIGSLQALLHLPSPTPSL